MYSSTFLDKLMGAVLWCYFISAKTCQKPTIFQIFVDIHTWRMSIMHILCTDVIRNWSVLIISVSADSFWLRFQFGQHTSAACPSAMMLLSLWFWGHCCKQEPSPLFLAGVRRLLKLSLDLFLEETLFTLISCFSAFITDQQHQLSHQPPDAALNGFSQLTNHMFKTKRYH